MNHLAHWMMRLYPKRWRARYGDELDALLADTGADARVVTDLFRGGIRMQFKTWSFLKLALALGLAGMLIGVGIAFMLPNEYTSVATMQITPAQISEDMVQANINNSLNERIQQMQTQVMSRTVLTGIINDPQLRLYSSELAVKPLEDVIEEMKGNIRIDFVALPGALGKRASAFDIKFTYPDRDKAQQTVRALLNAFDAQNLQQSMATPRHFGEYRLDVLDAATFPSSPIYPSRRMVALAGLIAALLLASAWYLIQKTGFINRRFALVPIAVGVAGLLAVIVANRLDLLPYQYRSIATLRLHGGNAEQVQILETNVLSRTSLSTVINDPRLRLYSQELRTTPLEDVIQTMKEHLAIAFDGNHDGTVFTISFDYPDRYKALMTVQTIMARFDAANAQLYPGNSLPPSMIPEVLDVLDTASLPQRPSWPNRRVIALLGGIIGVVLAAIIALIRRRWKSEPEFPVDAIPE